MLQGSAVLIAVAGGAFLAASYAPTVLEARTESPRHIAVSTEVSSKGDRLVPARPAQRLSTTVIEVVGISQPVVILRAEDGSLLYRSDPVGGSTLVVKNADLPVVTVREAVPTPVAYQTPSQPSSSAIQSPQRAQEGGQVPAAKERKPRVVGCEGNLSSLVKGAGPSAMSRCLV